MKKIRPTPRSMRITGVGSGAADVAGANVSGPCEISSL
jgi:hypothetical protein